MTETPAATTSTRPAMFLRAQFIKDLSFENPRAPASIFTLREPPQMEVAINLGAQRLDQNVFELAVQIQARALSEKTTVFLCDLVYSGVIEVQNIPDDEVEKMLFVQGAQLVYPYARRVVSDVTRDGGFPPVALEPIDFVALYEKQGKKQAADAATPDAAPSEQASTPTA